MTGKEIRVLRQARGLTMQALADRVGVGWATIQRFETGRPTRVVRLADRCQDALEKGPAAEPS